MHGNEAEIKAKQGGSFVRRFHEYVNTPISEKQNPPYHFVMLKDVSLNTAQEAALLKRSLGSTIRSLRKDFNWSQEELAARAGLHRTYVADVERGARNISLESIARLAAALEKNIAELFSHLPQKAYAKFNGE